MALTTCRECGKEVSGQALTCPHCGCMAPNKKVSKGINTAIWIYLIVSFAISLIVFLLMVAK